MSVGKAVIRPMMRALDDAPTHLRRVGTAFSKQGKKNKKDKDDVEENDRFDDAPGTTQGGDSHRPGEGGSGPNGEKLRGVDRGDGRDDYGHFVGSDNKPWVDKEQIGLDNVADRYDVDVYRDQVRATTSGSDQGRFYDGLFQNPDGTYTGVEVKSGNATRDAAQRAFDATVSVENPATAFLNGTQINIVDVILENVK